MQAHLGQVEFRDRVRELEARRDQLEGRLEVMGEAALQYAEDAAPAAHALGEQICECIEHLRARRWEGLVYEFLSYQVSDVMTEPAMTMRSDSTLGEVEALFEARGVNAFPVTDSTGDLIGIVSKLDLLTAFRFDDATILPAYEAIMQRSVREVMTAEPESVTPETPLTRVLDELVRLRLKSLPVVRGREVVGVVSREDVLVGLRRAVSGGKAARA